jgi:hypothetical protein
MAHYLQLWSGVNKDNLFHSKERTLMSFLLKKLSYPFS